MDNRAENRDFLTSRRAKVTPERAGLPAYRANRRVSGLRREEVAMLAGSASTRSDVFRGWWARHDVRLHRTGVKRLHHPEVGDLTLGYESMELTADAGLRLNAYRAEPGTPSYDALRLLASWSAPASSSLGEPT